MTLLSALILFCGTIVLYLLGAISGYTSKMMLLIFGLLLAAQAIYAIAKRMWSILTLALVGVGILGLWQLAGKIHVSVLKLVKSDAFLSALGPFPKMASFFFSIVPFLLLVIVVSLVLAKREIKWTSLLQQMVNTKEEKLKESEHPSIRICKDAKTGRDVHINGVDRYLHTMIVAPTGGGKTSSLLEPLVNQDLEYIAAHDRGRVIVVEPDGEFTETLREYCEELRIPVLRVDATNPSNVHWNPFAGSPLQVTETVTTVLKNSFGQQQAFYSLVQESAASNTCMVLKLLQGDDIDITDFANALRDIEELKKLTTTLKKSVRKLSDEGRYLAENAIAAIMSELKTDEKAEKFAVVCMGLRQQIEVIIRNPNIRKIMSGKTSFTFADYLETPGALLINTGNNAAGDMFGKFLLLSLQDATLSRPGTAKSRPPVFTYIDEYKRYATERYYEVYTQGRKYRNAQTIAFQSFSQLNIAQGYKAELKTNLRNKIIMTGLEDEDAYEAERMLSKKEETQTSTSYAEGGFLSGRTAERINETTKEKARFPASFLMFMPANQIVYKIVKNRQPLEPEIGIVSLAKRKTYEQVTKSKLNEDKRVNLRLKVNLKMPQLPVLNNPFNRSKTEVLDEYAASGYSIEVDIDTYLQTSESTGRTSMMNERIISPAKQGNHTRMANKRDTGQDGDSAQLSFDGIFD